MLSSIYNILKSIAEFFTSVVSFVLNLISDTIYVVGLLAKAIVDIPKYLSFLPPVILAVLISTFSIVVIYKILGRE